MIEDFEFELSSSDNWKVSLRYTTFMQRSDTSQASTPHFMVCCRYLLRGLQPALYPTLYCCALLQYRFYANFWLILLAVIFSFISLFFIHIIFQQMFAVYSIMPNINLGKMQEHGITDLTPNQIILSSCITFALTSSSLTTASPHCLQFLQSLL